MPWLVALAECNRGRERERDTRRQRGSERVSRSAVCWFEPCSSHGLTPAHVRPYLDGCSRAAELHRCITARWVVWKPCVTYDITTETIIRCVGSATATKSASDVEVKNVCLTRSAPEVLDVSMPAVAAMVTVYEHYITNRTVTHRLPPWRSNKGGLLTAPPGSLPSFGRGLALRPSGQRPQVGKFHQDPLGYEKRAVAHLRGVG